MWRRWADEGLKARLEELETQLAQERAKVRILQAELDGLAAVIARDRARVQAETSEFARRTAQNGG